MSDVEGIRQISLPTPFAVGRVNCWLIEDDPLTLVDCGPNSGKALDELDTKLRALGHQIADVKRIVLTHQHIDHTGLSAIIARRGEAEVCALDVLAPYLASYAKEADADDQFAEELMHQGGIPDDLVTALRSVSNAFRAWGTSVEVTHPLIHEGTLEFAGRTFETYHRPGHSPSDTVLYDRAAKLMIGGDHLLGQISSNPLIARPHGGPGDDYGDGRPQALRTYLKSLHQTAAMEIDVVLPGHGPNVTDHAALIDQRIAMHDRRAGRIRKLLEERPRTAYEVAGSLWGNVAVTQAFLALSEVYGHVDLLVARGEAREVTDDTGVVRMEAV